MKEFKISYGIKYFDQHIRVGSFEVEAHDIEILKSHVFGMLMSKLKEDDEDKTEGIMELSITIE